MTTPLSAAAGNDDPRRDDATSTLDPVDVPDLATLRTRIATLEAELARLLAVGRADDAAALALREAIVAAFRDVQRAARAHADLEAAVRDLAGRWKSLGTHATPTVSRRVDHLGASTYLEKGWSHLAVGRAIEAGAAFERALELVPDDRDARVALAWALLEAGEDTAAAARLRAVLLEDAQHPLARALDGRLALRRGDLDAARSQLTHVVATTRDARTAMYAQLWLGRTWFALAAYDEAIAAFERALARGPNLLEAAYDLGRARWFAGDPDGAQRAWHEAAAANKFNPWSARCAELVAMTTAGGRPPESAEPPSA